MNKELLINAINGTTPSYTAMDHPLIKPLGDYSGGFNDRWYWNNSVLKTKTEQELIEIYTIIKEVQ